MEANMEPNLNEELLKWVGVAKEKFELTPSQLRRLSEIEVAWNGRLLSRLGQATRATGKIEMNPILKTKEMELQFVKTFVHELAHVICFFVYGEFGHGTRWKWVMRKFGFEPRRCHQFKLGRPTVGVGKCSCREHEFKKRAWENLLSGVGYACNKCKAKIVKI
jgi:predicted SprT family Zn-dependent metalloprotease